MKTLIFLILFTRLFAFPSCKDSTNKNSTLSDSKTEPVKDNKKENEEKLNALLRDWNNAFKTCTPSTCASYFIELKRGSYSKNLKNVWEKYGCPQTAEISNIKITNITENSAEGTFLWKVYHSFEQERMFYNNRLGIYDGPFNKWDNSNQVLFEKGASGWQIKEMKTIQQGKDNRMLSYQQWKMLK